MSSVKARIRLLTKIAQAVPSVPGDPASPTAPASPDAPTTPASTTQATLPPPPSFQASGAYGWMNNVYNSSSTTTIDKLCALLNTALHYASKAKYNWQILRNNSFQIDSSGAPNIDTKNLLNLSMLVFKSYLNSGNQPQQKITGAQVAQWNNAVSQSQAFLNLSQISPTGPIAQKIPGNLKDNIQSMLRELAGFNPVQQTQQQ